MIQKVSSAGKGFRGVLNYTLNAEKAPEIVAGNMAGEDSRSLSREFGDARAGNEAVTKPVFHASLSADLSDSISPEKWREIAEAYIQRMGYSESLWVAVRHRDTDHDHIHIIASRVSHDGSRVPDHLERKRGETILRDLEREYGLKQVAPSREAERAAISRDELANFERTGQVSVKARLQENIDLAARDRPTMATFAARLRAQGVSPRVHVASTGRVSGISFELEGVSFKGSDVGRAYSWQGLQTRKGVSFDAARDLAALQGSPDLPPLRPREPREAVTPLSLERPTETYRDTAALVTRFDLIDRNEQLRRFHVDLGKEIGTVRDALKAADFTEQQAQKSVNAAFQALERAYSNPASAWRRLSEAINQDGFERAGERLLRSPESFGRLRGLGVGGVQTNARDEALRSAAGIGEALRSVGQQQATASTLRARPDVARLPFLEDRARTVSQHITALPAIGGLEREIHQVARNLGPRVLARLPTNVVHQLGVIAARFLRELARDRDRERGYER